MADHEGITASHVQEAMRRIQRKGIPDRAESTKFDVIDPETGARLPPKLVLSVASEIATGRRLSRKRFSGGEPTNKPLRELGFEIVDKSTAGAHPVDPSVIKPGEIIDNDQLTDAFGVGNAGGMRWSSKHGWLVIIADHTKSLYDDEWDGSVLHYTGMGRLGDQSLTGQNLRLSQQRKTKVRVHLFEVFAHNQYTYAGQVVLKDPVREAIQPDIEGRVRRVYVFPLRLVEHAKQPQPRTSDLQGIAKSRLQDLKHRTLAELVALARGGERKKPAKRDAVTTQYNRNEAVALLVKRLANGCCDLCENSAPFVTADGPFLECHHIEHLACGGADTINNTVALCPNCHRRMHALDRKEDRRKLLKRVAERASKIEKFS